MILDVAVTGVDMFGRVAYDDPYKLLEDRYKQKINKYLRVANQNGLQLIPAVFSHTGQIHGEVQRFINIKDQVRLQLTFTEGEAKFSKVELVFQSVYGEQKFSLLFGKMLIVYVLRMTTLRTIPNLMIFRWQ